MKKSFSLLTTRKALALLMTFAGLVGCGGGGGGGGGSPYITVTNVSPINDAKKVDARTTSISATFSAELDVSAFVTQGNALGQLLTARKIKVISVQTNTAADASKLALAELLSGKYLIQVNIKGTDTVATIDSYQFVKNDNGTFNLSIKLQNQADPILFTADELKNVIRSDLVKVQGGGAETFGQVLVKGNTVTFYPINFLNWATDYTITLAQSIKDTSGRPLQADYVWKFRTDDIPNATIDSVSPIGINANPIKKIFAKPNFTVNPTSLVSGTVIVNKLVRTSTDETPAKTPVNVSLSYDKTNSQIVIAPTADLEYLQEYEVVIKGAGGVTGSFGNISDVRLTNDYVWTFTTAEPAIIMGSPMPADATSPVVELNTQIQVEANFRPSQASIPSAIVVTDSTNTVVPYTFAVADGLVTITPKSLLKYGTSYSVNISQALKSSDNAALAMPTTYGFSFTTVKRKIISQTPANGASNVSENTSIKVLFNFDADKASAESLANFSVQQQVSGVWKDVTGNRFYDSTSRTLTFDPTQNYLFNAQVRVIVGNGIKAADGATISQGSQVDFTVRNQDLKISSTTPSNGSSGVRLNTQISARMAYPIDRASFSSNYAMTVSDCYGHTVSGSSSMDTDTIYFMPSENLRSYCAHTVTLDNSLRGTHNEKPAGTNSFSFTTDGLAITAVNVSYAYSDFVSVNSTLQIRFNYPLNYVYSTDVYLTDSSGGRADGTLYRSGSNLEFVPYYKLNYGQQYTLTVTTNVSGSNGEKLKATDYTVFNTENLPVDVDDYGPTGTVYVDDFFWVDVTKNVNTKGFPSFSGSNISPYVNTRLSTDGGYIIYMDPTSNLSYSTNYDVEFKFSFPTGGYYDNFNFEWFVKTESSSANAQISSFGAQAVTPLSKAQRASADGRKARSCRNSKDCVGHLKSHTIAEYKKVLASRKIVNIKTNANQTQIKALRALKASKASQ